MTDTMEIHAETMVTGAIFLPLEFAMTDNPLISARSRRFLEAAQMIAGPGNGWPQRFVEKAEFVRAAYPALPTVSPSHLHNINNGRRVVTSDMERLIAVMGPLQAARLEEQTERLKSISGAVARDLLAEFGNAYVGEFRAALDAVQEAEKTQEIEPELRSVGIHRSTEM